MMSSVFDVMGAVGAGILLIALGFGLFVAIGFSGYWVAENFKSRLLGFAAGFVVFVVAMLLFARPLDALRETSCATADDRQACIDGDDG